MDKIIKNYEEVYIKPVGTRQYIKFLKHKFDVRRTNKKLKKEFDKNSHAGHSHEEHSHDNVQENIPPSNIEIVSLAIVVDNVVFDVMNVQAQLGNILLKNPKFILVKEGEHRPHAGWAYVNDEFVPFEDVVRNSNPTTRG